jgi:arginine/lysine/ornithine decarboxylase
MNTPVIDFLNSYTGSGTLRCHMPGHKGNAMDFVSAANDITEICGADSLFEADGIIAESERNMSQLYAALQQFILPVALLCAYRLCLP